LAQAMTHSFTTQKKGCSGAYTLLTACTMGTRRAVRGAAARRRFNHTTTAAAATATKATRVTAAIGPAEKPDELSALDWALPNTTPAVSGGGDTDALSVPLTLGEGELKAVPDGVGDMDAVGVPLTLGEGELEAVPDGVGDIDAVGVPLTLGEGELEAVPDGVGDMDAVGVPLTLDEGGLEAVADGVGDTDAVGVPLTLDEGGLEAVPDGVGDIDAVGVPLGVGLGSTSMALFQAASDVPVPSPTTSSVLSPATPKAHPLFFPQHRTAMPWVEAE